MSSIFLNIMLGFLVFKFLTKRKILTLEIVVYLGALAVHLGTKG